VGIALAVVDVHAVPAVAGAHRQQPDVAAYYLLIGLIARSMTEFLTDNPQFRHDGGPGGLPELGTVEGYAATLFALLAVPGGGCSSACGSRPSPPTRAPGG
jgi:hypothetical protein